MYSCYYTCGMSVLRGSKDVIFVFNGVVFLVAVAGHALGFFVFGTLVFKQGQPIDDKHSDLSPMICAA